jgi:hypothetical protein
MPKTKQPWFDEDLLSFNDKRGKFSRTRALKVKRELRKLTHF